MATAYTLPYPTGAMATGTEPLPDFTGITPAQNAQITAILQQNGVLPAPAPALCTAAYIAAIPAAQQAYAKQLCAEGQAGYNIGMGIDQYNLQQVQQGLVQLPGAASAIGSDIGSTVAAPLTAAWNAISSVPAWLWIAGAIVVGLVVIEIAKP